MNPTCVWINGRLVPFTEAVIHVLSHVVSYAGSIFEGIRVYPELDQHDQPAGRTNIWLLREHIMRLRGSAMAYRLNIPYSDQQLMDAVVDTVSANPGSTYIRPVVCRGVDPIKLMGLGVDPTDVETLVIIGTAPWGKYVSSHLHNDGASVFITDLVRPREHFPGQAKGSAGYGLYSVPAKLQANEAQASEALLQGEDEQGKRFVVDGSGMNLCLVENGRVITPNPARWNILYGKTLTFLLEHLDWEDVVPWEFDDITPERLLKADEVFMTGTATEVTPVTLVKYGSSLQPITQEICGGRAGPITLRLAGTLRQVTAGKVGQYSHLLTPVPTLTESVI